MNRLSHCVAATVLVGLTASAAIASECEVEDWRSRHTGESLWIEGATTCEEGRIRIRAYDNSGDASVFIGVADGVVKGFIFETYIDDIYENPESLEIKYSIKVR